MEPIGISRYEYESDIPPQSVPVPVQRRPSVYIDLTSDEDADGQVNNLNDQLPLQQPDHLHQKITLEQHVENVPRPETMHPTPTFLSGSAILDDGYQQLDLSKIQLPDLLHPFINAPGDARPIHQQFVTQEKWTMAFRDLISSSYSFQLSNQHCQQAWAYAVRMCYSLLNTYHLRKSNPNMDARQIQKEYERQLLWIAGQVCIQIRNSRKHANVARRADSLLLINPFQEGFRKVKVPSQV